MSDPELVVQHLDFTELCQEHELSEEQTFALWMELFGKDGVLEELIEQRYPNGRVTIKITDPEKMKKLLEDYFGVSI